jgi:hypothetical protein
VVGDGGAGGLLETVAGEVHPSRVVAQLRYRVRAQLDLAERGGHLLRGRVLPQPGLHLQGRALHRRRRSQQGLTFVGQQPAERLEVHVRILAAGIWNGACPHARRPGAGCGTGCVPMRYVLGRVVEQGVPSSRGPLNG